MEIDIEYLDDIIIYLQELQSHGRYRFVPLNKIAKAKTTDKYIAHVKYYIDYYRNRNYPDVHFSDDYKQLYIG